MLSDQFIAYRGGPGSGAFAHAGGYNLAFGDGHTDWYRDPRDEIAALSPFRNTPTYYQIWQDFESLDHRD